MLQPQMPTREEWVRSRNPMNLVAVFKPGEMMRCTLSRVKGNGHRVTCAGSLGWTPTGVSDAVVRGTLGLPPVPGAEHQQRTCRSCKRTLDVFFVRTQELQATG